MNHEQSNPQAKRHRPIIKAALIAIGVAGAIAGAMYERQTIESTYAAEQAQLDALMRWSQSARASAAENDDASATTALRRTLRDAEQGQRRWSEVKTELVTATHELRYAEAQRSDTLDATMLAPEDSARIEAALTALEDAGSRIYRRKHNAGETIEATVRMAFVALCIGYLAVFAAMIVGAMLLGVACMWLYAIECARRRHDTARDA